MGGGVGLDVKRYTVREWYDSGKRVRSPNEGNTVQGWGYCSMRGIQLQEGDAVPESRN